MKKTRTKRLNLAKGRAKKVKGGRGRVKNRPVGVHIFNT